MNAKDIAGGAISGLFLAGAAAWFLYWQELELQKIEPMGSLAFGLVLGWVMRFFLNRLPTFTAKELSSLVSALVGAAVIGLFAKDKTEPLLFFYLSGLGFGFFGAQIWNLFDTQPPADRPQPHPAPHRS
ncbi:hypothetical protein ACU4GR_29640 [Methylobacterium oryzae CBMB20]